MTPILYSFRRCPYAIRARMALKYASVTVELRDELAITTSALLEKNDRDFKKHLDHYKYADRYPEHPQWFYRAGAENFLRELEQKLERQRFLMDDRLTFSDVVVFPFVRQFANVDQAWFDRAPYPGLQAWLRSLLDSELFLGVMEKSPTWREGQTNE